MINKKLMTSLLVGAATLLGAALPSPGLAANYCAPGYVSIASHSGDRISHQFRCGGQRDQNDQRFTNDGYGDGQYASYNSSQYNNAPGTINQDGTINWVNGVPSQPLSNLSPNNGGFGGYGNGYVAYNSSGPNNAPGTVNQDGTVNWVNGIPSQPLSNLPVWQQMQYRR